MPGVPSGKGCDGCRLQKKKCDQQRPQCSRCARLNLTCVGAGEQRYKFKSQNQKPRSNDEGRRGTVDSVTLRKPTPLPSPVLTRSPSNELTWLTAAFVHTIKPSTSLRFNLQHAYGGVFSELPQRLGANVALDAAIRAVLSGHSDICARRGALSCRSIRRYSDALAALRLCLDDEQTASSTETLCAVYVLLICQSFMGVSERSWTGHCEGAIHILRARGRLKPRNFCETVVLAALRGPLIFSSLLSIKIRLTPSEWQELLENELDGTGPETHVMTSFKSIPGLMERICSARDNGFVDEDIINQLWTLHLNMTEFVDDLHVALENYESRVNLNLGSLPFDVQTDYACLQRSYTMMMALAININCMLCEVWRLFDLDTDRYSPLTLKPISPINPWEYTKDKSTQNNYHSNHNSNDINRVENQIILLQGQSQLFTLRILSLAERAHHYRPIGSSYINICLVSAFAGAPDHQTRTLVFEVIKSFAPDFSWAVGEIKWNDLMEMRQWARFSTLGTSMDDNHYDDDDHDHDHTKNSRSRCGDDSRRPKSGMAVFLRC